MSNLDFLSGWCCVRVFDTGTGERPVYEEPGGVSVHQTAQSGGEATQVRSSLTLNHSIIWVKKEKITGAGLEPATSGLLYNCCCSMAIGLPNCQYICNRGTSQKPWKPYRPVMSQDFSLISGFFTKISFSSKYSWKKRSSHQGKKDVARIVSKPLVSCLWGCGESFKIKHPGGSGGLSFWPKGDPGPLPIFQDFLLLSNHTLGEVAVYESFREDAAVFLEVGVDYFCICPHSFMQVDTV